jgi:hypothetical protein
LPEFDAEAEARDRVKGPLEKRGGVVKVSLLTLVTLLLVVALAGPAFAVPVEIPFSETVDFKSMTWQRRTVDLLRDGYPRNDNVPYEYSFQLDLEPPGADINEARLSLTHRGNSRSSGENWFIGSEGGELIGRLSRSTSGWVTDRWVLGPDVLGEIESSNPWSLTVVIRETTGGTDTLYIDLSTLAGRYLPVPAPAAVLLLSTGLLGLIGIRRLRRK